MHANCIVSNAVIVVSSLLVMLMLGTGNAFATDTSMRYLTSIENTRYHLLRSERLKHDYHLFVHTPDDVKVGSTDKFATIYLLDGGITYPLLAAYSRYLNLAEDIPPVIIVGLSYGARDFREGNKRSTDFTAPAASRDHYGGAENFQAMLAEELFPLIEDTYPSNPQRRILFGQSIGGQFAIYNALFGGKLFYGLIASNPALHRNLDFFLQPRTRAVGENKPMLFLSLAENDDPVFKQPTQKWLTHWQAIESKPFILKSQYLRDHNHFSPAPAAFRNGLRWLLDGDEQSRH
jgi:predicted alpha/beta superfamily hydrolase